MTPHWANAGLSQPARPGHIEEERPSLDFASTMTASDKQNPAGPPNFSVDRYVPWQAVQRAGLAPEIIRRQPASSETVLSFSGVPNSSGAGAAPKAELAISPQVHSDLPASSATIRPSARSGLEEPVTMSMPPGPAPATPQGTDSLPEAWEGSRENGICQPSKQQQGSACTEKQAELLQGHHEAPGLSRVLSQADAELGDVCAFAPAHPCLLAAAVNKAVLMKPVSGLGNLEKKSPH